MRMAERIREALTAGLAPERLEVVDQSHLHVGHAGHRPGGETHFHVTVVSAAFEGLSRPERHRRVYALLAEPMRERVHALGLTTLTPAEAAGRGAAAPGD